MSFLSLRWCTILVLACIFPILAGRANRPQSHDTKTFAARRHHAGRKGRSVSLPNPNKSRKKPVCKGHKDDLDANISVEGVLPTSSPASVGEILSNSVPSGPSPSFVKSKTPAPVRPAAPKVNVAPRATSRKPVKLAGASGSASSHSVDVGSSRGVRLAVESGE